MKIITFVTIIIPIDQIFWLSNPIDSINDFERHKIYLSFWSYQFQIFK